MVDLIPSCWQSGPGDRPSFEEIFILIERAEFQIVPSGNSAAIRAYCDAIQNWEWNNPDQRVNQFESTEDL
jgi:hypothetical protein